MLWHRAHWYLPLTGLAIYKGSFVWFVTDNEDSGFISQNEYGRLTDEETERLLAEYKKNELATGKHCNNYPGTYAQFDSKNACNLDKFRFGQPAKLSARIVTINY